MEIQASEIDAETCKTLYTELKKTWRDFRKQLVTVLGFRQSETRAGRISSVHKPAMMPSEARRLGARFRPRFRIKYLMSHQDGLGNNGTEPTGLTKSDDDNDRMQKKSENVAHAQDGIKLKKLKNSGRLRNSPTTGSKCRTR